MSRILAIELADIGDLILITPALRAIREGAPTATLDVLTTVHSAPILDGTRLADQVITFDKHAFDSLKALIRPKNLRAAWRLVRTLRTARYDTVLVFHHLTTRLGALKFVGLLAACGAPRRIGLDNGRGWFLTDRVADHGFGHKHQVQYWLDLASRIEGVSAEARSNLRLVVGISPADRAWAAAHLPTVKPLIAIHAGSGGYSLARRWEPEKFAALADRLARSGAHIVLVGSRADDTDQVAGAMQQQALNLAGQTTLGQLAAVLERCDRFYGADSGVMHIAAAAGTQVIGLFGPSNAAAWGPYPGEVRRTAPLCSPCSYIGNSVGLRAGCAARTCMRTLSVDDALAAPPPTLPRGAMAPALHVLGVPIHALTFESLLDQVGAWMNGTRTHQVCTVNPEFLMIAQRDSLFYTILQRVDLCAPDGVGLLWAARRLGHRLPERVTGSDGVPMIAERAASAGWAIFFLGAAPGVAEKAAAALAVRYPGLQIAGTYAGSPAPDEEDGIIERVNKSGARILFVAYGAPQQDKWIARNLHRFTSVRVAIGVGGSLDFAAGEAKRAPLWMRQAGIEWLYRLLRQPRRARRMLRLPRFVFAVLLRGSLGPRQFEVRPSI
jgi:exopolysaccharide biosynthesis WecB/TagA/CpsF family protein